MTSNFSLHRSARRQGQLRPYQDVDGDAMIGLRTAFDIVMRSRGLIAAVTLGVTALGTVYAFVKKPVYEGNMLLQVAQKRSGEQKNMLGDVAATLDKETTAASEVGVIRSRAVISNVVNALRGHTEAAPRYFPLLGARIAAMRDELSEPGLAGYGGYCWGAERIVVTRFDVPGAYLGRQFVLTRKDGDGFDLADEGGHLKLAGRIGVPLLVQYPDGARLHLQVALLDARPGAQFILTRRSALAAVEDIQEALLVTETGKDTGLISVTLRDANPQTVYTLLSALGEEYIKQYEQRKTQSAEKSYALLATQLPALKQRMEAAEMRLNVFRNKHGTADLAEETKSHVQRLAGSEQRLVELEQKKAEALSRFGPDHPAPSAIDQQIRLVTAEKQTLAQRVRRFPMLEQELGRLSREVNVGTELYTSMLRTAQELRLIAMDKAEGVRLVDLPVVPDSPVTPRSTTIGLAAACGLLLGLLGAFMRKVLVVQ